MKKAALILSLFLLCIMANCANIAIVHSAHVNNTGRDSLTALMIVGNNTVTPYLNQNIKDLADHLEEYDAVVTSVLFNYDTPADFSPYTDKFRKYVENGGIIVYSDMNYPSHYNALESVFPEYIFRGDKNRGKSGDRAIILEPDLPIFKNIGEFTNSWACVSEISDNWTILATDSDFNPTIAIAPIGKGFIVASTTYTEYSFPTSNFVINLINNREKFNTSVFADNFSLKNQVNRGAPKSLSVSETFRGGYKLQGPKELKTGKQKFTVPGADNFKIVNQSTNETFKSKNKTATVNFDNQGTYYLYAIVYDKNNKITGYSPVSAFYAEDVISLDVLYPCYNDIVQSKDP
ncbi:MAG: hypothetical protein KBT47_04295, partial [Armatimonadetes bacterium]|nr:hypothetical protein [Candidatus Hippobium faecium]